VAELIWTVTFLSALRVLRQAIKAQIPLGSSRHAWTRHGTFEPMHFGCVELVEQHGSTRSCWRARHVERDVTSHVEGTVYFRCATIDMSLIQ